MVLPLRVMMMVVVLVVLVKSRSKIIGESKSESRGESREELATAWVTEERGNIMDVWRAPGGRGTTRC
jgi:hypothetical protein